MQKTIKLLLSLIFVSYIGNINAQTYRDTLVSEIVHNFPKEKASYEKLKADIKKLRDLEGKPNPEILHNKLRDVFQYNDTAYFKEILTLLTRKYGFNLSYASGEENYYHSIIYGELAEWFKEMYIKNHSEWLSENLEKQIDIYKLSTMSEKDKLINGISAFFHRSTAFTHEQKELIEEVLDDYSFNNIRAIVDISAETGLLPTGNSLALVQKSYDYVELHNLQRKNTFEKTWKSLYPLYKASYLNKDISFIKFRTIDFTNYKHNGKQIFNSIKIEDLPEYWRNNPDDTEIPLTDPELSKKMRIELGWE